MTSLMSEGGSVVVCKRRRDQLGEEEINQKHLLMMSSNNNYTEKNEEKDQKDKIKKKTLKKKSKQRYELVPFRDLPEYMKDNEYILDHYRANWPIKVAFFSLFHWHNETLNVWTHLLGFVLFLGLTVANTMQVPQVAELLSRFTRSFSILTPSTSAASNYSKNFFMGEAAMVGIEKMTPPEILTQPLAMAAVERWPFFVFLAGSMFCLLSSSMCHLFCCHSKRLNIILLRFDYVGIVIMIITSFFPPIYYIFQCDPQWQFIYLAGISLMGVFTVVTLLSPALSTSGFRKFRAFLFFSMGFSGIVPAIHASIVNWNEPRRFITLAYESAMALSYATGTLFYVTRVPERWKPGWFDLAGHSHQIFHVLVIMGALAHYGATLIFLKWREEVGCNNVRVS